MYHKIYRNYKHELNHSKCDYFFISSSQKSLPFLFQKLDRWFFIFFTILRFASILYPRLLKIAIEASSIDAPYNFFLFLLIKYEIKLLSTKSVNPQFEKNLDKIIKKAFDSSAGKSLMSGSSYVGISQLKA